MIAYLSYHNFRFLVSDARSSKTAVALGTGRMPGSVGIYGTYIQDFDLWANLCSVSLLP